jgi:serine/threonine-protein kinase
LKGERGLGSAMIESVEDLLLALRRMQLLAPEQLEQVARELGPHYNNPADLAGYLTEIDWLTPFQSEQLFSGCWEDLALGPYQMLSRLGEGGVSEVFKAWDTHRGREVALKVLRQDLNDTSAAIRQFQRELVAVTRLNHTHIIKTFDASQLGRLHYFAMEFVEGLDLNRYVTEVGGLPLEYACDFIRMTAQGLQHAYQMGLVHRDIKPANLFLINPPPDPNELQAPRRGADPFIKILDWGLARLLPSPGDALLADPSLDPERGMLIGTADYIAPEQSRDASLVDIRSDIYSLGCTFYFLLAGHPPFPGNSLMQKLLRHQNEEPVSIQEIRPDVPNEVAEVVHKMLAKNPNDRYQIPLLVVAPLRHYTLSALGNPGSVIRSSQGASPGARPSTSLNVNRPGTVIGVNGNRPPTSPALGRDRPASQPNLGPIRRNPPADEDDTVC